MEAPEFQSTDLNADLERLLASGDLCSKSWIFTQYDWSVRTNTTLGPGSDAAIVRIKETNSSVAISLDGNGRYCYLDPREGTKLIVAECCRNLSTVGALPVATTNNLNFGNPERPEIMAQLVESIEGMAEACAFFDVPVTGGNVSLYNETLGGAIFPTPVVGIVGILDTAQPISAAFQQAGRSIILLGGRGKCDGVHFGGTQYAKYIIQSLWGLPPELDMDMERRVQSAMRAVAAEGLAESAHDLSDGGLAVALAECSFGNKIGARVQLDGGEQRPEFLLFGEAPSRILLSTANPDRVSAIASEFGVEALRIGDTIEGELVIRNRDSVLIDRPIASLRERWASGLQFLLESRM
jgi:phosphoribosylformylglycinamidine synthase